MTDDRYARRNNRGLSFTRELFATFSPHSIISLLEIFLPGSTSTEAELFYAFLLETLYHNHKTTSVFQSAIPFDLMLTLAARQPQI